MEQQQQNQVVGNDQEGKNGTNNNYNMCRQSSTRWTPTSEQIRILKELYYNNGVRSPSAEQIQKISARLRQYGKIEGKNVFYWFQNHKARERQKKRFTSDPPNPNSHPPIPFYHPNTTYNPNTNHLSHHGVPSASSSSSHGVDAMGHTASYGYGSVAMENSFRDCSISPRGHSKGGKIGHNFGYPHSSTTIPYPFLDQNRKPDEYETLVHDQDEEEQEDQEQSQEIETLPLFPMHGEEIKVYESNGGYNYSTTGSTTNGWIGSRASLELSLNSYASGWSMN